MKLRKLFNTNIKKRVTAAVLVMAVFLSGSHSASASKKIDDANEKKDEAEENLNEVNQEIEDIKKEQNNLQKEMDAYDEQLMALLTDMELLDAEIAEKDMEIEQANIDLENAKEQEASQYEAMKTRIQYMYENGDGSLWTAVVESEGVTDFLNRVEYVTKVYDYDRDQLIAYQETVENVQALTEELNIEMAEMEELQLSYQDQEGELEALIAEKSEEMSQFSSQLASAQKLARQYASTIKQQNQIIAAEEERIAEEERLAAEKAAAEANNSTESSEEQGESTGNGTGTTSVADGTSSNSSSNSGSSSSSGSSTSSGSSSTGLTDSGLNPAYTTNVSGNDVVSYACQFVGNPYKYGGTSLTEGSDCSYFVMACFQKYGIYLPRTSTAMQSVGQAVSYDCAKPGDIICYSGHVAIYMGNGQIVHASSPTKGICYGTATYRTIKTIRRVL